MVKGFYKLMTLDDAFGQWTFACVSLQLGMGNNVKLLDFGQHCQALKNRGWRIV